MDGGLLLAMLLLGAVSGIHCVGMCGGIVGAFSMQGAIPIRVQPAPLPQWPRLLLFNAGRISSYAAAGAAAGSLGGGLLFALEAQTALYVLANVMLVLVGLYLAGLADWLARLEALGLPLWRRLQPLAARLASGRTPGKAYAAGLAWGFLPCGLVYGALAAAAFAGSPARGALAMAAFGAGTLPYLLAAGLATASLRGLMRRRAVRVAAGGAVLAFGVYGLANAGAIGEGIRRGFLCL
jgi:sulfite exporter TauE/SafE